MYCVYIGMYFFLKKRRFEHFANLFMTPDYIAQKLQPNLNAIIILKCRVVQRLSENMTIYRFDSH